MVSLTVKRQVFYDSPNSESFNVYEVELALWL